jgi:UDP-3-O-[3-hydroxymyristoyl] glucosamine N-acyltransferase
MGRVTIRLDELAKHLDAELVGDPSIVVDSVGALEHSRAGQVSFLANPKYARHLHTTGASAVIVGPLVKSDRVALLRTKEPYLAFAKAMVLLHGFRRHPFGGVHPKAYVDPSASVGADTVCYPGVYVGPRARVGRDCVLHPNVVVYDGCVVGDRVTIHANTTIGADGFGYATVDGAHNKIPQIGNVVVEDDVEIGSGCSIDRATLGSTIIGRGSKLNDNIAIGHGVKVGPGALIVSQTGIAGSTTIGTRATIAGQAGIAGHLRIGDDVTIGAQSLVMNDQPDQTAVLGTPAIPIGKARRVQVLLTHLPELADRIKQLEYLVEELAQDADLSNENSQGPTQ